MPAENRRDECTPEEAVERIRRTPANPGQIRLATVNLADVLRVAPTDPTLDAESWQRQWSEVEAELSSLTRANDIAEGRRP
jgi:hypothetical protein